MYSSGASSGSVVSLEIQKLLTDIGLLEGGRVVDTVSGDGHDGTQSLTAFDDDQLLLRGGTGEHDLRVVAQNVVQLLTVHVAQFTAVNDGRLGQFLVHIVDGDVESLGDILDRFIAFGDDADGFGDGFGRNRVITGNHDDCQEIKTSTLSSIPHRSGGSVNSASR